MCVPYVFIFNETLMLTGRTFHSEPLNVNKELKTVGMSNMMSGLFLGQTGSYIFSQT